jgi:hypothetical protein
MRSLRRVSLHVALVCALLGARRGARASDPARHPRACHPSRRAARCASCRAACRRPSTTHAVHPDVRRFRGGAARGDQSLVRPRPRPAAVELPRLPARRALRAG